MNMCEREGSNPSGTRRTRRDFLKQSAGAAVATPGLLSFAGGEVGRGRSGPDRRPNVVLLHADQFRWDAAGIYGLNPMGLTPNLDAMARLGTLFQNAIVNQPLCSPSRACLMTDQYPAKNGARRNGAYVSRV